MAIHGDPGSELIYPYAYFVCSGLPRSPLPLPSRNGKVGVLRVRTSLVIARAESLWRSTVNPKVNRTLSAYLTQRNGETSSFSLIDKVTKLMLKFNKFYLFLP